ncbi:MAG TPA: RidA family protein, partial [bacterium]|nr:RidA family protein [bacterium]
MSRIESRLAELGLRLGAPKAPVANYLPTRKHADVLYVSGRVSERKGAAGADVTPQDARIAARDTMLDLLAILKQDLGSLDRITRILQLRGFVRSAPDFTGQPQVVDGASDLLIALWGEDG